MTLACISCRWTCLAVYLGSADSPRPIAGPVVLPSLCSISKAILDPPTESKSEQRIDWIVWVIDNVTLILLLPFCHLYCPSFAVFSISPPAWPVLQFLSVFSSAFDTWLRIAPKDPSHLSSLHQALPNILSMTISKRALLNTHTTLSKQFNVKAISLGWNNSKLLCIDYDWPI